MSNHTLPTSTVVDSDNFEPLTGKSSTEQQPLPKRNRRTPIEAAISAKQGKAGNAKTKADVVIKKLRSAKGVTINALMEATGWQAHSVRGFLSGTVKRRLGLILVSEVGKDGIRRYRIDGNKAAA